MQTRLVTQGTGDALQKLKSRFISGKKPICEESFWDKLTQEQKRNSVDNVHHRPFADKTAWNSSGKVRDLWKNDIKPGIIAVVAAKRKCICPLVEWDPIFKCRMIGESETTALPTVVMISHIPEPVVRLRKLLKKEDWFIKSGFGFYWSRGPITWTAGQSSQRDSDDTKPLLGASISIIDEALATENLEKHVSASTVRGVATFGAKIIVGDTVFGLTAFHPFMKRNRLTHGKEYDLRKTSVGDEHFLDDLEATLDVEAEFDDEEKDSDYEKCLPADLFLNDESGVITTARVGCFVPTNISGQNALSPLRSMPYNDSLDWALITLERGYDTLDAETLSIAGKNFGPCFPQSPVEGNRVIVLRKDQKYRYAKCTGETVLINPPGATHLVTAYSIAASPALDRPEFAERSGESGAIVLDLDTNAAYGIIVAESDEPGTSYMIAMKDIFHDIREKSGGQQVRFPHHFVRRPDLIQGFLDNMDSVEDEDIKALFSNPGFDPSLALKNGIRAHNHTAVHKLLEFGADVNYRGYKGFAPLKVAMFSKDQAMVELLLQFGADVNARDSAGSTALETAVFSKDPAMVELLLQFGADVNARDSAGETALETAVFSTNPAMVELLLQFGADVNARDVIGSTALDTAVFSKDQAMVKLLLQFGADVNMRGYKGLTPLMHAVRLRSFECLITILEHGADIDATSPDGISALSLATEEAQNPALSPETKADFTAIKDVLHREAEKRRTKTRVSMHHVGFPMEGVVRKDSESLKLAMDDLNSLKADSKGMVSKAPKTSSTKQVSEPFGSVPSSGASTSKKDTPDEQRYSQLKGSEIEDIWSCCSCREYYNEQSVPTCPFCGHIPLSKKECECRRL